MSTPLDIRGTPVGTAYKAARRLCLVSVKHNTPKQDISRGQSRVALFGLDKGYLLSEAALNTETKLYFVIVAVSS